MVWENTFVIQSRALPEPGINKRYKYATMGSPHRLVSSPSSLIPMWQFGAAHWMGTGQKLPMHRRWFGPSRPVFAISDGILRWARVFLNWKWGVRPRCSLPCSTRARSIHLPTSTPQDYDKRLCAAHIAPERSEVDFQKQNTTTTKSISFTWTVLVLFGCFPVENRKYGFGVCRIAIIR